MTYRFKHDGSGPGQGARSSPGTVHHAAETGNVELLQTFVDQGIERDVYASITLQQREAIQGMMPIHLASENGQLKAVEYLISKRVDLEAGTMFRATALHLAAWRDHVDVAQALLAAKVAMGPQDQDGDTPLHWAASKGFCKMIDLLVKHKSPVNAANKLGWTPLHRAVYNGHHAAVASLVNKGASLLAAAADGSTPLHLASVANQMGVMQVLLGHGSKMDVLDAAGRTPYDVCINAGARELLDMYGYSAMMAGRVAGQVADQAAGRSQAAAPGAAAPPPQQPAPAATSAAGGADFGGQDAVSKDSLGAGQQHQQEAIRQEPRPVAVQPSRALSQVSVSDNFPDIAPRPARRASGSGPSPYLEAFRPSAFLEEAAPHALGRLAGPRNPYAASVVSEALESEAGLPVPHSTAQRGTSAASLRPVPGSVASIPSSLSTDVGGRGRFGRASSVGSSVSEAGLGGEVARGAGGEERPFSGRGPLRPTNSGNGRAGQAAEDRTSAPAGGLRPPRAGGAGGGVRGRERTSAPADGRPPQPNKSKAAGNKKFLSKYNLQKLNLFAAAV